ncbi:MAG TPA: GNAT family N-acetyltransferase [Beijerinckiaceae bacterium]
MSAATIREARAEDIEAVARLFAEDSLGGHGDRWDESTRPAYEAAFAAIAASPQNHLFVLEEAGAVVGTFQVTFLPGFSGRGALRAKLEGVQVRGDRRSRGYGALMIAHAEAVARAGGAASLALTSNKARTDAHRFYERLGYARTHEGFKKTL